MKNIMTLLTTLLLLGAMNASAALVNAYWNFGTSSVISSSFNGSNDPNLAVTAETWVGTPTIVATGSEALLSISPTASTFEAYDTSSNAGAASLAWNTNSTGNSFTVSLDMTGLKDLQMRFDYRKRLADTFTGFSAVEYMVGAGSFTSAFTAPALTDSSNFFSLENADLNFSSIAAIEDVSDVQVRFSFADMPTTSSSFRIDNLQLQATAIPEPSTAVLLVISGLAVVGFARRRKG